jgi:Na+:H+ antiporter, NhaC family
MSDTKTIPFAIALIPVLVLISLLTMNVIIFGDDALFGSNQIVLIFSAAIAAILAMQYGSTWHELQDGIVSSIRIAIPAILILLMVGALAGSWLLSGVVPTMIYYGLFILSPGIFLVAAAIISAIVSVATGSSWTTSATIGIALMGIGQALGINPGFVAGAILSGAYFGDKLSPLSDTTNLASGVGGTDLFTHIRYMTITTIPSISIALIIYLLIGFFVHPEGAVSTEAIHQALNDRFNINPLLLLVPAAVIFMIVRKVHALPAIFIGAILGGVFALIFQMPLVRDIGAEYSGGEFALYIGIMQTYFGEISIATGNETLDGLLTSGGMGGMLITVWLIISAMIFGGIMESSGFLVRITSALIAKATTPAKLVSATAGTCIFTNVSASDQYLSIVVPGRMFADAYEKIGLAPQNLSRTLEDSGTVTSVLIPWNTCGAYHASVLGVSTLSYAPFAFFCFISPIMTMLVAWYGWRLVFTDNTESADAKPAQT